MTCAPSDRIMQTLRTQLPGATDDLIQLVLFNVMDRFFRRSQAWRFMNEITLEEGTQEYAFSLPVNTAVVRMLGVSHNDIPLYPVSASGITTQSSLGQLNPELTFPDGDAQFQPAVIDLTGGNTYTYAIYRPEYITTSFIPDPEQQQVPLVAWFVLTLAKGCLECDCGDWEVPEWTWDVFFDDWVEGVQGEMFAMPAKPWSNPTAAILHGKRFRNAMAYRKQESLRGFVYGAPGWRFPMGGW